MVYGVNMPVLMNPKHERFAQNIAAGMNATEAYKNAGYGDVTRSSGHVASGRLRGREDVKERIREILGEREIVVKQSTARAVERVALSKEFVLEALITNVRKSLQMEPILDKNGTEIFRYEGSVANRALELLGRELGMFIDRKEIGTPGEFANLDANSVKLLIAQRLGLDGAGNPSFEIPGRERSGGEGSS